MTPAEIAEKLAELEARLERATPAPWKATNSIEWDHYGIYPETGKSEFPVALMYENARADIAQANAALIVFLVNNAPTLLRAAAQALREQGKRVEVLEEALKDIERLDGETLYVTDSVTRRIPVKILHSSSVLKIVRRALQQGGEG